MGHFKRTLSGDISPVLPYSKLRIDLSQYKDDFCPDADERCQWSPSTFTCIEAKVTENNSYKCKWSLP